MATNALQSHPEPLEGSAHSELCRRLASASTRRLSSFLQLTFPIMPTQPESVFTLSGGGHWGEDESESEKEDNTVQKYSETLSLVGSFNSVSVLSSFCHRCYLLAVSRCLWKQNIKCERELVVLNTEKGVKAWHIMSAILSLFEDPKQIQMDTEETEMWFEFLNSILALTGPQPKVSGSD